MFFFSCTSHYIIKYDFLFLIVAAGNGILARLNGQTVQVINLQTNTDWSDYCHYSSQYAPSLRKILSVTCRTLGYEDLQSSSSKENQLMNVDINQNLHYCSLIRLVIQ